MGSLKRKDNSIVFKNEKGNTYLPVEGIRELFCLNEVSFNSKFLDFVAKAGIVIHFFNYYGYYSGSFYPRQSLISGRLTVKQSEAYLNNRLTIAKAIIKGIAENTHEILYHYYKHDKKQLKDYLYWLKNDIPRLLNKEDDIKRMLWIEGLVWQNFYQTFREFLPEDFLFNKRVKRPPDNPLNALISFGNSLLYAKTITQIYQTHLNQSISYLHEPGEGRFSLSLDLSEVFKPIIVFRSIFNLVNNKKLKISRHFNQKMNYCMLNDLGRKLFINEFEDRVNKIFLHGKLKRKTSFLTAIKLDGYKLVKYLMEEKEFKPFSLKEMI
jgi:CRISPR-associated protein Cas1